LNIIRGLKNESSEFIENPRKYDFFVNKYMRMVEVSCGNYHIAVVAKNKDGSSDNEGYVFTWGLDLFGRLGYISDFRKNDKEIHDQGILNLTKIHMYLEQLLSC
jgi:alpha-tubulin suppressor-like RCC1 family protein